MASARAPARRKKPRIENSKTLKRKREVEDLEALQQKINDLDPKDSPKTFPELPFSQPTQLGLKSSHFVTLTDIQSKAIPLALKGGDVLGAAKTGSGKTLAFLVPVLENLYRERWTEYDGLGALILSPTRELAIQIFEVLRKIGRYHKFSAGLVIGGKSLQEERERLGRMNILVCTPGRMLQHMDQTAAFEVDNLQMLVLDEADRILDMGFQQTVDAIIEHLPKERQTMLFSATQTRKVSDLARLSLKDPEYVAVHETATTATPSKLQQHYVVTPLPEKLDTLWSFIRANLKSKILVFLSSGKQVRFVYECFRQLQPGVPLLHLMGKQKQNTRLAITSKFSSTQHCCLFATDIAARGLDFPAVDWVIQLDCPEDADTYIHRAGRTARYEREGRSVLFLDPSEEKAMISRLEQKKVPIEEIKVRQKKQQSIKNQLQNMCFKNPELKYTGQKAFVSYVKSIHLQKDKEIFDLSKLSLEEFSDSLGLPGAPRIKFMKGEDAKRLKNRDRRELLDDSDDENTEKAKEKEVRTKYDRMFERRNQDILADHNRKLVKHEGDEQVGVEGDADEDDGFMQVKRRLSDVSVEQDDNDNGDLAIKSVSVKGKEDPFLIDSKRREKMLKSKKSMLKLKGAAHKLVFDDEGNPHELYEMEDEEGFRKRGSASDQRSKFIETEAERVKAADVTDKQTAKEKKRMKKIKRKEREAAENEEAIRETLGDDNEDDEESHLQPAPTTDFSDDSEGESTPAPKRQKKWFEDDSDDELQKKRKGGPSAVEDANTLEDLEALATSYL